MLRIVDLAGHQRNQLVEHAFVRRLTRQEPWEQVRPLVPLIAFWVSAHADLLGLVAPELRDPGLRGWAEARRDDAAARARAYREATAAEDPSDPVTLFGPPHTAVRHATYAVLGEAIHAGSDPARFAVAWSAEVAWDVLTERAARYRRWPDGLPRFLSPAPAAPPPAPGGPSHPGEHREAVVAVERTFDAFRSLLDGIRTAALPAARLAG